VTWNPANQYHRVCFTANIPTGRTFVNFSMDSLRTRLNPAFMIGGQETASTGQPHFQGYFELPKKMAASKIMKHFEDWGIKAHLEAAKGSADDNIKYCSKEDKTPFRFGEPKPGQGTRTDLGQLFQAVKDGATDEGLIDLDAGKWAVHRKALQEYRMICTPKRSFPSTLVFLYGPTGTGKTMHAQELSPQTVEYRCPFMIGYTGASPNVLFDDFDWTKMSAKYWLTLCDRYAMTVETKGGSLNWAPKIICFTSNDDPKTWWPEAPQATREAIHRRMDEFGEIKMLGALVPKSQNLLDKYLTPAAPAPLPIVPALAGAGAGAGGGGSANTEPIDLTQDSDSDAGHCRDADEHSDCSNEEYYQARQMHVAKRIRRTYQALTGDDSE